MAVHAEHSLASARISQVLDLLLAVPATKAPRAICLIAGEDGEILDLIATGAAAIRAVVADERTIAEKEQVRIRVKDSAASVAFEALEMPAMPSYFRSAWRNRRQ